MAVSFKLDRKLDRHAQPSPSVTKQSDESTPEYLVELFSSEKELCSLENAWNLLNETSDAPNSFASFDWYCAWNRRFLREDRTSRRQLNLLVVKKGDIVTGIIPLIRRQVSRIGFSIRKIEFTGPQADYNDFIVGSNSREQFQAIAEYLAKTQDQWDLVDLRDLHHTANSMEDFAQALGRAGLAFRVRPERERCPYLRIDAPWEQWLRRRSQGSRRAFRNKQSRIEKLSSQGLRIRLIDSPHREGDLLEKLVVLENQKRIKAKPLRPFIARYTDVFQTLFETLGPRGSLLVAIMEMGRRPLAWQLWFRCGQKLWMYQTAYDHEYARLSPGTMLVPAVMDYACARGYTEMDFLRGEEPYKMRWANDFHQTFRLVVWSRRWKSRARKFLYLNLKEAVYERLGKGD